MEQVDTIAAKSNSNNKYIAWGKVTPKHNKFVEALLSSPCHIIGCMRAKTEYSMEKIGDKTVIKKLGMAPIQREGMDYEFDVILTMDYDHMGAVTKSRCDELTDKVFQKPGEDDFGKILKEWLNSGAPVSNVQLDPGFVTPTMDREEAMAKATTILAVPDEKEPVDPNPESEEEQDAPNEAEVPESISTDGSIAVDVPIVVNGVDTSAEIPVLPANHRKDRSKAVPAHTQRNLINLAHVNYQLTTAEVGPALRAGGFTAFDPEKWDEMVAALKVFSDAKPVVLEALFDVGS